MNTNEPLYYGYYQTEMGIIQIEVKEQSVISVCLDREHKKGKPIERGNPNDLVERTAKEIMEYLRGERKTFDVKVNPFGTEFQKKVWRALLTIPYGETRSYQDIAKIIGHPKACRAVGGANHQNPIMILIPCHRVIGANGKLTGYAGGLDIKEKLLNLEKRT